MKYSENEGREFRVVKRKLFGFQNNTWMDITRNSLKVTSKCVI